MSFFKLVMIVLLKRYAAGKTFGETGLKAIRDTFFFQHVACDQGRDKETHFLSEWYFQFPP